MARERGTYAVIDNWARKLAPTLPGAAGWVLLELSAQASHREQGMTPGNLLDAIPFTSRTIDKGIVYLIIHGHAVKKGSRFYAKGYQSRQITEGVRTTIPLEVKRAIFERDGGACTYCGSTESIALDHVMPWSRGGDDTADNLVLACRSCNSQKGAKTPEEWRGTRTKA